MDRKVLGIPQQLGLVVNKAKSTIIHFLQLSGENVCSTHDSLDHRLFRCVKPTVQSQSLAMKTNACVRVSATDRSHSSTCLSLERSTWCHE